MYQSIWTLQLVCPIYRAPHHYLHEIKGTFPISDEMTKKVNLRVAFLLLPGLNHNGKGHILPTLIQYIFDGFISIELAHNRYLL